MRHTTERITYNELKEYLHYNPITGVFTQLVGGGRNRKVGTILGRQTTFGYKVVTINGKSYKLATLAYLYMEEKYPDGLLLDHKDTNKANDAWNNIRVATNRQNAMNVGLNSSNTSGIKGVCWHKRNNSWIAQIRVDGKVKHIGYFRDIKLAEEAIIVAREKYHGEFANHG